jgi:hypothetical protein
VVRRAEVMSSRGHAPGRAACWQRALRNSRGWI